MDTFIWSNGKPQAMKGYNDDLLMSMAIACWVRDTALTTNRREVEYKEAFFNAFHSSNRPLITTISGMTGHKTNETSFFEASKQYQDYIWLMKG